VTNTPQPMIPRHRRKFRRVAISSARATIF
jgi:hypothetical protein